VQGWFADEVDDIEETTYEATGRVLGNDDE
jgi:hypothetical protein